MLLAGLGLHGRRRVADDPGRGARLAAKPIIDMQISVADLEPLAAFRQPLERLGYVYRADNPERTKRYFREPPGRARTLCTCAGG